MPRSWRSVDSGLVSPPLSAALDEAILEEHVSGNVPDTLHFYVRACPTISIGYFQKVSECVDVNECERRGIALVRRKSGGSSIYTDSGQLIYGLVLHEEELPSDMTESFRVTCSAIAEALQTFGVDAVYRPANDVEVHGKKVSGNAQLRRKGSVLQHGTILVDTDLAQMDAVLKARASKGARTARPSDRVTTLRDILGSPPKMDLVKDALTAALGTAFEAVFSASTLTRGESVFAEKLVAERYSRDEWNLKF
jgi:lipoate-protein ligase A